MTQENHRYSNRTGLSGLESNNQEIDDLIEEAERSIANTRKFLEQIHLSETENKRYVEQIRDTFEGTLRSLKRRRDQALEDITRQNGQEPQPGY